LCDLSDNIFAYCDAVKGGVRERIRGAWSPRWERAARRVISIFSSRTD